MVKSNTAPATPQSDNNPTVLIRYEPAKYLSVIGVDAREVTKALVDIKIVNQKTLEPSIEATEAAKATLERIEVFRITLVEKVREAAAPFAEIDPFFEGLTLGVTLQKWPKKTELEKEQERVRALRANYLSEQEQKRIQEQNRLDAEQREKNQKIADNAAKAARSSGADTSTVKEIKREILQTPAPLVASKAVDTAKDAGVGLQYDYSAEIFDLSKFLTLCLNNPMMMNTLAKAKEDMEKVFRSMATDQKERFVYSGIRFKKTPRDVQRRKS